VVPFKRSKKVHDVGSLREYALGAIGRRMRTVAELKRLMRQKQIAGDAEAAIGEVVAWLKERGYLNDSAFAATYSANRRDNERFGKGRVTMDLKMKGVHGEVIERAVHETYDGVNEEQLARDFLRRKRVKPPVKAKRGDAAGYKQSQKDTARIFRLLARAGFSTRTAFAVLKTLGAEDETLTALEEERGE